MSKELFEQIIPENRAEVEAHCVTTLFARARQATMLAQLGTLFIFWVVHDMVSLALALGWMIVNSLPDAITFLHTSRLLKNPPPREQLLSCHNRQMLLRSLQGLCWGSAAVLFHVDGVEGELNAMVVLLVLISISSVSVVNMAPSFRTLAFFSFSILIVPILYFLSLGDHLHVQMAVGLCILLGIQLQFGWDAYRQFAGGVHQLVQNQRIGKQLEQRNVELDELNQMLRVIAIHDQLTGLFNRHFMVDQIERQRELFVRHGNVCSIVLFDIDHFKLINDQFGHGVGDDVLAAFSRRIEAQLRQGDTLGRYGGEEFVLLLPMTDRNAAMQLAERIRSALAASPVTRQPEEITVTASFGVAQIEPGEDAGNWLLRADQALYRAKEQGRNRVMA
ncbi:MAG: GGDEF domain-containing protein [Gammaproteobacteria bacterium]|nr:GGDEF domain-containing protein [Gammaproteobacteria bacterium]